MRVFLCGFGNFSIAIPMSSVSTLALYTGSREGCETITRGENDGSTFISLPLLFGLGSEIIKHSITLNSDNKIVLLCTEVELETDIPDEEIYPLPKVLDGTRFYTLFSGIKFASTPVLFLDTKQLIQKAVKEMAL